MVWSKASHLMSRKWVFCGMMCNLLCKLRKTIHEKSRFKALKTWIIYFFECNNLLRIQDGPFNPKYLHFDFWLDLEQCALVPKWLSVKVERWKKTSISVLKRLFFSIVQLWRTAILEPVGVPRHNVPHFKGLIKLYLD